MDDPQNDPAFHALLALSARLGRDPQRTQAAGGNTSLKRDGILWIKASGTWLAEAENRAIMVPVRLAPLLAAIAANDPVAGKATDFVVGDQNPAGLRPSVETAVHAVIPRPVVVHIHCMETVALVVRPEGEALVGERLATLTGLDWMYVPYVRPGLPLARAIAARIRPTTRVIVLGNHGLVVAADTVAEAEALVEQVCAALKSPRRSAGVADPDALREISAASTYRLPAEPAAHDVATDPASLAIARQGTLYPDHVIFLGSGIRVLGADERPRDFADGAAKPIMLAVPGRGVLIDRAAIRGTDKLARALADATARIPAGAAVRCLTTAEEAELTGWEAEEYRRAQAGAVTLAATE